MTATHMQQTKAINHTPTCKVPVAAGTHNFCMIMQGLTLADEALSDQAKHDTGAHVTLCGRVKCPHDELVHVLAGRFTSAGGWSLGGRREAIQQHS